LIAGLIVAAPPGPVNVYCSRQTLAKGRRVTMIKPALFMFLSFIFQSGLSISADSKPLPGLDSFLQNIRGHLHSNWIVQSQYTYNEQIISRQVDSDGKLKKTEIKVYEVYPSADEQFTYKKLILKDDKPVSAEALNKGSNNCDKRRQEWQRRFKQENADQKRRREESELEAKRKEEASVNEAFRLYQITMIGRKQIEGVSVIGLSFEPRQDYMPKTEGGSVLRKVRGKAWFSEEDHEYVRIEAELNDSLSFGLGFIVRLNKGTRMIFQRRKINNEVWLPVDSHFTGTGRIFFLKGFQIDKETIYSGYQNMSVETNIKCLSQKQP
jgi:hypothetical protein